jgi:hypothetical protein
MKHCGPSDATDYRIGGFTSSVDLLATNFYFYADAPHGDLHPHTPVW